MSDLLENIKIIAKQAGKILLDYYDKDYQINKKSNDSNVLLTTADIKSEEYIISALKKNYPDCQILSEERTNKKINFSSNVFIVDPLDGTRYFVKHKETFSIVISLYANGAPQVGVVHLPKLDETYYAEKNRGAFLEKRGKIKRIHVSNQMFLNNARVFNKDSHHKGRQSELLKTLSAKKIMLDSATSYKICLLAKGDMDIFINTSQRTSKWDICAPHIILEEAGGKITDFNGQSINYKMPNGKINLQFFATNGYLHNRMLKLIKVIK